MTPPIPPVHPAPPAAVVHAVAHGPLATLLGTWSRPPDLVAWAAAALGLALLLVAIAPAGAQKWLGIEPDDMMDAARRRRYVLFAGFVAAFLSLGYIAVYLRGGPRIIDATTYFLQGRALAHGKLAWKVLDPTAEFRGRFLLFREPDRLAGIFPPGYPLLLAAGFLVGAPMVIGPLLAAALVGLTYLLTRELLHGDSELEPHAPAVASLGVALSVACAALRYHTADTMAHGAAAAGIASALLAALRARRTNDISLFAVAGLAVGWVLATRMVSALPIAVVVLALAMGGKRRGPRAGAVLAGFVPGLLLLALADRAATGSVLTFAQRAYYAVSDGPPGCFRYGFGAGVGCLDEHGEFVRAHLANGFGIVAACGTTLRRLRMHLLDVANFEPLALLVVVPAFLRVRSRATIGVVLVVGQIVAYAPFYFDGNYPGGGARFYADVLPVEHALVAIALAHLWPRIAFARRALALLSLVCLGFAVHAVHEHVALAARDGGRPAYEPDAGRDAQITHGLVFFDTDAGFNLAFDPKAEASHALFAARQHTDDHDRLLYERLGRPPAYTYRIGHDGPSLVAWTPTAGNNEDYWRFESEADWPPIAQSGGWAESEWLSNSCASEGRALSLHPTPDAGDATVTIELPVPRDGRWLITPRVLRSGGLGKATLRVVSRSVAAISPPAAAGVPADGDAVWSWSDADFRGACNDLAPHEAALETAGGARLVLTAQGGKVSLDRMSLRWKGGPKTR